MPFLGVQPTDTFASVAKQTLTGDLLGTTVFTLDHGVSSANDIALYINNVRQEPVTAYTASGSTLTLTESINAADDAYVIFIARTYQSVSMKGIADDTEDPILTIDGSLTTGGDAVLNVGQNQASGYYVQDKTFGFEISNGGVGGNTAQIKNAGNVILSHNQIQDNLILRTNNTGRVTILSGGNVGIGETDPDNRLHVKQSADNSGAGLGIKIEKNADDSALFVGYRDNTDTWQINASYTSTGSFEPISFHTSDAERMRIDSSGNVGIGVTDPDEKLEISGGDLKVDTNGTAGVIHFSQNSDETKIIGRNTGHATLPNTLDFYVNSAVASRLSERNASFGGGYTINNTVDTSYAVLVGAGYGAVVSGDDGGRGLFGTNVTTTNANVPVIANTHGSYGGIGLSCSWGVAAIVRKGGSVTAGDTLDTVVRFDNDGLKFGSDTAAANALDDYEEGTWTATLRGSTEPATLISDASNYYTKIGNVVKARISLENIDTTGYAGDVSFTGLPFTSANNTRTIGTLISYRGMTTSATATTGVVAMVFPNSSTISTREGDSNNAWLVPQHSAGTGKYFFVDIVYMTA